MRDFLKGFAFGGFCSLIGMIMSSLIVQWTGYYNFYFFYLLSFIYAITISIKYKRFIE